MNRPLIGITTNPFMPKNSQLSDKLAHTYCKAVQAAGGIPLMLPTIISAEEIAQLRDHLDGILLSGGGDVAPGRFPEADTGLSEDVSEQRDELELALVNLSLRTNWPLLGICRGCQVINVALGGTLYTDIPTQVNSPLVHNSARELGRDYLAHEVTIIIGTDLAAILGEFTLMVNSFHHQSVKQVGAGLRVSARASDGLVEGLELPGQRFFLGVQWHPECLPLLKEQQALFEAFIQSARSD
jgi:putative glutamine amidotransferase